MRVSVIIPCHNAEAYIGEALRSVAEQTRPPDEIIVVDDGSTDGSVRCVEESGIDLTLLRASHGNAAASRNDGIEAASGDWIAFQDADDVWYPHHLERAMALLEESDDVAFQSNGDLIRADAHVPRPNRWPIAEPTSGLPAAKFVDFFRQHLSFVMPSVVVRRDVLIECGMFDPALPRRHDMDMWLRVTEGRTWAYDPGAHVAYRADTPGSVSRTNLASSEYWHLKMLLRHRDAYAGEAMEGLVRRGARATMNSALTDGGPDDVQRARDLAWPHLTLRQRALYHAALMWPSMFATLNRSRRARLRRRVSSH